MAGTTDWLTKPRKSSERILLKAVWQQMVARCHNQEHKDFPLYGRRGIEVCRPWHTLDNFIADMGPRPRGFYIDRINNDLGYSPENCRWVSPADSGRNKRNNLVIEWDGEVKTLTDWARQFSYDVSNLHKYFKQGGSLAVIAKLRQLKERSW
jgi:hypothetical protein